MIAFNKLLERVRNIKTLSKAHQNRISQITEAFGHAQRNYPEDILHELKDIYTDYGTCTWRAG